MKRFKSLLYSQKLAPYVFIAPFVIVFLVFFLYPIISTVTMSFQSVVPGQTQFIGLDNYRKMWNTSFITALKNSAVYMVCTCAILIPVPMLLAAMLNSRKMIAKGFFRSALFLPALICVVVAGITFRLIFGELPGSLMNTFLNLFGIKPVKWLAGPIPWTTMFALVILCCWRWMGVNTMYYLSALQSISEDLYESADLDGANAWQKFRHISVPLVRPTTIYVLTISIYGGLAMFVESRMLFANTEVGNQALTIVGYLYRVGIRKMNYGLGSAIGIVLLILTLLINITQLILTGFFRKE
ncbi:MAG: sugar ABC transporter permease [Clostridia bacterium]|nr:sugar ABC transporter permease [Clostridia bacterium]